MFALDIGGLKKNGTTNQKRRAVLIGRLYFILDVLAGLHPPHEAKITSPAGCANFLLAFLEKSQNICGEVGVGQFFRH